MLKLVSCEAEFPAILFCLKKLVIAAILHIFIHFLGTILVTALSRRESVDPELCFPVLAHPPVEFLFFILLTNSSMLILPLSLGLCLMPKFLSALPYFFVQLYAVAGQISALLYSLKCLLTSV